MDCLSFQVKVRAGNYASVGHAGSVVKRRGELGRRAAANRSCELFSFLLSRKITCRRVDSTCTIRTFRILSAPLPRGARRRGCHAACTLSFRVETKLEVRPQSYAVTGLPRDLGTHHSPQLSQTSEITIGDRGGDIVVVRVFQQGLQCPYLRIWQWTLLLVC